MNSNNNLDNSYISNKGDVKPSGILKKFKGEFLITDNDLHSTIGN